MRDNSCTAGPFEKQNILPDRPSASTPRRGATHEGWGATARSRACVTATSAELVAKAARRER